MELYLHYFSCGEQKERFTLDFYFIHVCRILSVKQFVYDHFNIIKPSVVPSITGCCFARTVEDIAV